MKNYNDLPEKVGALQAYSIASGDAEILRTQLNFVLHKLVYGDPLGQTDQTQIKQTLMRVDGLEAP